MQRDGSRRGGWVVGGVALALTVACAGALPAIVPAVGAVTPEAPILVTLAVISPTPAPTATQLPVAGPASPTPTVAASSTPAPLAEYVVVEGDTLWGIATGFGIAPELLLAANPGIDPNQLTPGQALVIPAADTPLSALPTPAGLGGWVTAESGGLHLRAGPGLSETVLTLLLPLTPLELAGRTPDNQWLQVRAPGDQAGWVSAQWVALFVALETVPVVEAGAVAAAPAPTLAPTVAAAGLPEPTPTLQPGAVTGFDYGATISGISPRAREIFLLGQALGNKPNVFSKIGDSITASPVFLAPIGGGYQLHDHAALQGVIDYFFWGIARDNNSSFANVSLAAKVSWRARAVMSPAAADPAVCRAGEAPLNCEYRLVRPAVALIMLGTNDVPFTPVEEFEADLRRVLDTTLEWGVIPVLSTLPPLYRAGLEGRAELLNTVIVKLAREYDIPLWDYYAALAPVPGAGMAADGVHPSWAPVGHSADFSPEYLQFGMTVRNLTGLYALDAVWRSAMQP